VQVSVEGSVAPDGSLTLSAPPVPRGSDAVVRLVLHNGWSLAGETVFAGAVAVKQGPNAVVLGSPGTDAAARAAALSEIVVNVPGDAPAAQETTGRENPSPVFGADGTSHPTDRPRSGMRALLVIDLSTTTWSVTRSAQDRLDADREAAYLAEILTNLGFAVDVVDAPPSDAAGYAPYALTCVVAYNGAVSPDKVPAIRAAMESRRMGVVLVAGVPALLSTYYPPGGDIISAGSQVSTDLAPAAGVCGFRTYTNASGLGFTTRIPGLFRTTGVSTVAHLSGASLAARSAVSPRAQVVAVWSDGGGRATEAPWCTVFEIAGEPSDTVPGTVNTSAARAVWMSDCPRFSAEPTEARVLDAMWRGAALFAVGAIGRLDGSSAPDWDAGIVTAGRGRGYEVTADLLLR
jgi:hypothetical protein